MYIVWIRKLVGDERVVWEGVVPSVSAANQAFRGLQHLCSDAFVLEYQMLENWRVDLVKKGLENLV